MFWKQGNKAVYRKSNSINNTLFQPNNAAAHYTKKLLTSMDASEREVLGQGLLEEMARSLSIPVTQLLVNDKRQNHSLKDGKLRRKVYGTYKAGNIVISNKTAIREAVLAPKTFLDTLIHEFMHHYDYEGLNFPTSLHTAGFLLPAWRCDEKTDWIDLTRTSLKCKMKRLKCKFQNHSCILHFAFSLLKMSKFHCLETKPISLLSGVDYSSVGWVEERNPTFLGKIWHCWVSLTPCPTLISDLLKGLKQI